MSNSVPISDRRDSKRSSATDFGSSRPAVKTTSRSFDPRQSMARPDYEIFHYHDRRMQEVPLHHRGRVEYLVEGRSYTLEPGDVLLISPMELHRPNVAPEDDYERMVLWVSQEYLQNISGHASSLQNCFFTGQNLYHAGGSAVGELFRRLTEEEASSQPLSELCARGLFLQLMAEVARLVTGSRQAAGPRQEFSLVNRVLDYIAEHYAEDLSLDFLAERFYVSKYYLSHRFSETVGTSVYRYILLKRLQQARQLIASGGSPGEVCLRCGFQDYANFYRAFKNVYGVTPQQSRAGF